jgi:FAD-dependent urate hydroxylase
MTITRHNAQQQWRIAMKALVIGGGIAGISTALALHKAGIDCDIFEARDRRSDGTGAFLTLAVNGIAALRLVGLDVALVPGIDTPAMNLSLGNGRQLTTFPLGPALADGTVTRTVKRSDLYRALRARATELDIPVFYGNKLVDAAPSFDSVTARFEDGSSATGDLLIGADGLHSHTRTIIDPRAPKARYLGILNAGGYASASDLPDLPELSEQSGTLKMIFGKKTFFSYIQDVNRDVWWFANPAMAREPARNELAAIPEESWRQTLLDLVDDDAGPATDIIRASGELFSPWPTHDFPSAPIWHRDRMVIIGDAAHAASPSSGQGASMAIEDAVVLGIALRDNADVARAFDTYDLTRRKRVARVVAQGKRNGTGKTPGPFGRQARDFFLRRIFSKPREMTDQSWLYACAIDWDRGTASVDW